MTHRKLMLTDSRRIALSHAAMFTVFGFGMFCVVVL